MYMCIIPYKGIFLTLIRVIIQTIYSTVLHVYRAFGQRIDVLLITKVCIWSKYWSTVNK